MKIRETPIDDVSDSYAKTRLGSVEDVETFIVHLDQVWAPTVRQAEKSFATLHPQSLT